MKKTTLQIIKRNLKANCRGPTRYLTDTFAERKHCFAVIYKNKERKNMLNENSKPILYINFNSPDSNIFFIRQKAIALLKEYYVTDRTKRIEELCERIEDMQSYDEALSVIGDYVRILPLEDNR